MTSDERSLVLEAVCDACLNVEVRGLTPAQRTDIANLVRRDVARRLGWGDGPMCLKCGESERAHTHGYAGFSHRFVTSANHGNTTAGGPHV